MLALSCYGLVVEMMTHSHACLLLPPTCLLLPAGGKIFVAVACGQSHTLCLTSEGEVYASGSNANNQLGLPLPLPPPHQPSHTVLPVRAMRVPYRLVEVKAMGYTLLAVYISWISHLHGSSSAGRHQQVIRYATMCCRTLTHLLV